VNAGRPPVIAGNWKMNPASAELAVALALDVRDAVAGLAARSVVCPPTIWLSAIASAVGGGSTEPGRLGIGAQTMHAEESGAYTGETSPLMVAEVAQYAILGHSERRQYDNETDAAVAGKVASAVAHGLVPIACIGELAEERRAGLTVTGDAASGEDAQAAAAQIRAILAESDPAGAEEVSILYGGSCTPDNAAEFFAEPDVDGALVGGASLNAGSFARIVQLAVEARA